jgi:adenylate cyclase
VKLASNTTLAQAALSAAFVILMAAHVSGWLPLTVMQRAEALWYDTWLKQTAMGGVDDRVAVLDIDERSLREIGRWPWSRDRMVTLMDRLFDDYGVAAIGLDVVFAEPDTSSGLDSLSRLAAGELAGQRDFLARFEQLKPQLDYDARFARALAERPVSLGYYFIPAGMGDDRTGALPEPVLPADAFGELRPGTPAEPSGYGANLEIFQRSAPAAGYFNMLADVDGTARQMSLIQRFGDGYHLSLSATTLMVAFGGELPTAGVSSISILGRDYAEPWIDVSGIRVPLGLNGAVHVPYRAGSPFPYISAADVLNGQAKLEQLENRIVLLGSTAPGLSDLRVTPFSNAFPGVEIHANLIVGMLDGRPAHMPAWADDARLLLVLLPGALLVGVLLRFGPTVGLAEPRPAGCPVGSLRRGLETFLGGADGGTDADRARPVSAQCRLRLFRRVAIKRQITKLFGQYVPPELAQEMSKNPTDYTMEGPVA